MTRPGGWVDPYAGMHGRRVFIAVPLPASAVAAVTAVVEAVRARPLTDGAHDVRWVRLDGLHLTLRFLGPASEERIAAVGRIVTAVATTTAPIGASLAGTGTFPPTGRPRTLWIGLRDGVAAVEALAGRLNDALASDGWPTDVRPLRPHLTLARADGIAAGPTVAARLGEALGETVIDARIDRLTLFESVTGGGPARYVPITDAALGGQP